MPELFKLVEEREVDKEWRWTYSLQFVFTFNEQKITEITITDHTWQKKGREKITKELILNLLKEKVNGREILTGKETILSPKEFRLVEKVIN